MARALAVLALPLALAACGSAPSPSTVAAPTSARTTPRSVAAEAEKAVATTASAPSEAPAEHWYLEQLAAHGRHALLRRLDASGRMTLQTRIVDVDTGDVLEEVTMPELGRFPGATIGLGPKDLAKLDAMMASPRFADDLMRGAHVARRFPAGSCGRLAAGADNGAIAFNAGDWLYVTDASGRARKKLAQEAAYGPHFSPDGKYLFFRRVTGTFGRALAKYELFVMPADLSQPPRPLAGTAGVRDTFDLAGDGASAIVLTSQEPAVKTCVLSVGLRPPFAVKRLGCLDGGEQLVESAVSPKGRWVALTTVVTAPAKAASTGDGGTRKGKRGPLDVPEYAFRLRVLAGTNGQVAYDTTSEPGYSLRGISDGGTLVQSGIRGVLVDDVTQRSRRVVRAPVDLGHRAFFRDDHDLVVLRDARLAVVDVRTLE